MDIVALAGRILFSVMFVTSGINHLTKRGYMGEYAKSMGVPSPSAAVVVSGLMILTGGLMVAAGIWGDLGALLIAVFLLSTAYMMHPYWKMADPQQRQMQQVQFMKNLSLTGGALAIAALFHCGIGLTLTGPLFG